MLQLLFSNCSLRNTNQTWLLSDNTHWDTFRQCFIVDNFCLIWSWDEAKFVFADSKLIYLGIDEKPGTVKPSTSWFADPTNFDLSRETILSFSKQIALIYKSAETINVVQVSLFPFILLFGGWFQSGALSLVEIIQSCALIGWALVYAITKHLKSCKIFPTGGILCPFGCCYGMISGFHAPEGLAVATLWSQITAVLHSGWFVYADKIEAPKYTPHI